MMTSKNCVLYSVKKATWSNIKKKWWKNKKLYSNLLITVEIIQILTLGELYRHNNNIEHNAFYCGVVATFA